MNGVARFSLRPEAVAPVEAVQVTSDADWAAVAAWCGGRHEVYPLGESGDRESVLMVPFDATGEFVAAYEGYWVVRRPPGFAVFDDREFTAMYEPAVSR